MRSFKNYDKSAINKMFKELQKDLTKKYGIKWEKPKGSAKTFRETKSFSIGDYWIKKMTVFLEDDDSLNIIVNDGAITKNIHYKGPDDLVKNLKDLPKKMPVSKHRSTKTS